MLRAVCEVTTLTELRISGAMKQLPPEIGQLTALTKLKIENNKLTSFPAELGLLTKLSRLYAYSNKLRSLPDEVGALVNLQKLVLWSNELAELPEAIGAWTQLTHSDYVRRADYPRALVLEFDDATQVTIETAFANSLTVRR